MIIPLPVEATSLEGAFPITPSTVIAAGADAGPAADYLAAELLARTGLRLPVSDTATKSAISLRLDPALKRLGSEGYSLEVKEDGTAIRAFEPTGLFYGVQTLLQLLDLEMAADRGSQVPCVRIEDRPRYPFRGFMLDSSRHFQSVQTVCRILDQMAYLKLNVLHWHLTDDQGWRLEIKRYPRLTEVGAVRAEDEPGGNGFYSHEDVREILAYAKARHITVVPEIEMPAHCTAAMACYPELTCSGTHTRKGGMGLHSFQSAEGAGAIFCAGREETYRFIEGVLTEVMELFDSPIIHIGGDERPEGIWPKCPRCQAVMEREGLKDESALQAYFMRRVADFVNRHGRRTMAWCPTVEHGLPENQLAEDWYFGTLQGAVALGHDVVNARDRYTYLDYPNFPGRQKPDWMPELWVDRMYEFNPTPEDLDTAQAKHILGSITSLWTEFIEDDDLSAAMFPRMLAFSEVVWTPQERRSFPDFEARMKALEAPLARMGVTYAVPSGNRPVMLARPANVTTSMAAAPGYPPECAFDSKYVRCFLSATPPKADDHLTVTLHDPAPLTGILLYTGADVLAGVALPNGELQVSTDGAAFRTVAPIHGERTEALLPGEPVKAVRVKVTKDMDHPLAITEIVLR